VPEKDEDFLITGD